MIWAKKDVKYSEKFHSSIWKVRDYIRLNYDKLKSLQKGRHEMPEIENGIYVMINEYETKDQVAFESHKKYVDLQLIFEGKEVFEVADISNMKEKSYDETKDYAELLGKAEIRLTLSEGQMLVLLPNEAHAVGLHPEGGKTKIHKAVFKIPYIN